MDGFEEVSLYRLCINLQNLTSTLSLKRIVVAHHLSGHQAMSQLK